MHADPIWDMLNRLKTASMAGKTTAIINYSNVNRSILNVLKRTKYILWYSIQKNWNFNVVSVSLSLEKWVLNFKRVSKPWCRIYIKWTDIKPYARWYWIFIISTSQWVMPWFEAYAKWIWWEVLWKIS